MRSYLIVLVLGLAALVPGQAYAQSAPFLGAWNLTGEPPHENHVYWLEVKEEGGTLSALFLNRGGSPVPVQDVRIANGELSFTLPGRGDTRPSANLRAANGRLTGTIGAQNVKVSGARPPQWGACDANATHTFGKPVNLYDGKSLAAWGVQHQDRPMGWKIEDGAMTNEPKANNLVSKEKFQDFRIDAEYKISPKGNSGMYLRGRYEMQVLDDAGAGADVHGHLSVYARRAPAVNASKPAGEWQTAQITLVGNCVTAVLNGQTVHDNVRIAGITGGALDAKETEPGPIMIQGDHGTVWFRKLVVTPITSGTRASD